MKSIIAPRWAYDLWSVEDLHCVYERRTGSTHSHGACVTKTHRQCYHVSFFYFWERGRSLTTSHTHWYFLFLSLSIRAYLQNTEVCLCHYVTTAFHRACNLSIVLKVKDELRKAVSFQVSIRCIEEICPACFGTKGNCCMHRNVQVQKYTTPFSSCLNMYTGLWKTWVTSLSNNH